MRYTTDPEKAERAAQVGELRRQLRQACQLLGCSGVGPSCRERPERCAILQKLTKSHGGQG